MAAYIKELGVKPEIECFGPGDIMFARQLISEGLIEAPPLFQFVLGMKWGAPPGAETVSYLQSLLPDNTNWACLGIAREQMRMVAQSVLLGGNIRVGLEDNLYLERGVFATNSELVEMATKIVRSLGDELATPDEARKILGLRSHH